jgi:hypothetical protein
MRHGPTGASTSKDYSLGFLVRKLGSERGMGKLSGIAKWRIPVLRCASRLVVRSGRLCRNSVTLCRVFASSSLCPVQMMSVVGPSRSPLHCLINVKPQRTRPHERLRAWGICLNNAMSSLSSDSRDGYFLLDENGGSLHSAESFMHSLCRCTS